MSARVVGPTSLIVVFDDGTRRRVNLEPLLRGPVFEPLHRPAYFRKARADSDSGTVVWPNGADIAPETLYEMPEEVVAPKLGTARRSARRTRRR
ncbi:MAG TPA: DUF2442 domain-containing protein [Planctomycetota bacterium]|nr:DUF2442 domain-containing protein [Planctomycetota bacterium]